MNISKQAASLWAKKRSEDGFQYWLPLITHLIDAEKTIDWLFTDWLCEGDRQILRGSLSEERTQRLIRFVAFIHDIGKATPAFQLNRSRDGDDLLDSQVKSRLYYSGLIKEMESRLASPSKSPHALAGEAIVEHFGIPESVGAVIGGHHGKPADEAPSEQIDNYTANYYLSDNNEVIQRPWKLVQSELFEYGLVSAGFKTVSEVPSIQKSQAIILEGLLIMTDWLVSSEYLGGNPDIPLFPLIKTNQTYKDIKDKAQIRFELAKGTWNIGENWIPQKIIGGTPYEDRWQFKARPVQEVMTNSIGEISDPGIAIIEAPMGIGKTEIALVAAEQLAQVSGRDGFFIGLPTQATTNAMFDRVEKWQKHWVGKHQLGRMNISLTHSRNQFNENYMKLPRATNMYTDEEDKNSSLFVNDWFIGKKSILSKFVVGTIDSLLLMGLKQKHLFLKHLGFSGKVVIIDEVHAYDAFMSQYLYKVVSWLGVYHVPIVILSATLPKGKRCALMTAYLNGKYGEECAEQITAPKDWQKNQAYPLLSILDGKQIKQIEDFPSQAEQKPVKVQVHRLNTPDDELIPMIIDQIKDGGVAGIIVNTVKRAQMLAAMVPADIKLMVLHSAFLATDRAIKADHLMAAIGSQGGKRPDKMIVIGTQVLEQSLDIDFDILYTDIAPMDLILQRMGRLHRHQIIRPDKLRTPHLFIMGIQNCNKYGDGNESVYDKYLLMKTDHFMKSTITLPDDISPLVQKVYDRETDYEVTDIIKARKKFDIKVSSKKDRAENYQIDDPEFEDNDTIHAWLKRSLVAGRDESAASAAVRDIKETLEVILVQHTEDGNLLLDGHWLDEVSSQQVAQQIIRLPAIITINIDQAINKLETLTSRYFSSWQDDIWLKGCLALPLDENFSATFEGWQLVYSKELRLSYGKDEHE
ncbi:CRISPR-associated helicase Cas3' [Lactiplantibacillus dongliensis]|uniref:CRISPR-associated helicase Cas3 n=1 Tax=Lactiplantibacillus dongliensis TaxID=2559919 RepID=A0ABW1R4K0_9LACO|nr:CRISPR-associated helicase Cas3' [Lactiplantibacillus dongliensis]